MNPQTPENRFAAVATAIEQGLVDHISAAYDALTALGYDPDNAQRELVHTCNGAIAELAGEAPAPRRATNKPRNASLGANDSTSNRV